MMSSSSGSPESWISSFCSLLGHEYFAEVSEDFIEDDFNLTGLQTQVAMYKEALEVRTLFHVPKQEHFMVSPANAPPSR
jgi:casein kinase II subunit beta